MSNNEATSEHSVPLRCPTWNSPVLRLTPTGLLVRCKSCRHGSHEGHEYSKEQVLLLWAELERKYGTMQEKQGA
jgi:hypothetical protein